MKKILLLLCGFIASFVLTGYEATFAPQTETPNVVYVCIGGSATKYHKKANCAGLNGCKGSIKKMSLEEAQKNGKTPCKKCCK